MSRRIYRRVVGLLEENLPSNSRGRNSRRAQSQGPEAPTPKARETLPGTYNGICSERRLWKARRAKADANPSSFHVTKYMARVAGIESRRDWVFLEAKKIMGGGGSAEEKSRRRE